MSVSAAYCVSEILSVGRCRSVSEAAERKSWLGLGLGLGLGFGLGFGFGFGFGLGLDLGQLVRIDLHEGDPCELALRRELRVHRLVNVR